MLWEGGGREQRNGEEKSRKGPRFRWERGGKGIGEGAEREERERRKDQSRRVSYVLRGRVLCTTGLAKGGIRGSLNFHTMCSLSAVSWNLIYVAYSIDPHPLPVHSRSPLLHHSHYISSISLSFHLPIFATSHLSRLSF